MPRDDMPAVLDPALALHQALQQIANDGEQHRHQRKLKRGAHRGNAFRIALRGDTIDAHHDELVERVEAMAVSGVPNYFGEQRFGRNDSNLRTAERLFARPRTRLSRNQRSMFG